MCRLVMAAVERGCGQVIADLRRLLGKTEEEELPKTDKELSK